MSVLIKGMEMPTNCADCPLGGSLCCPLLPGIPALWAEYTNAVREKRRHSDCPLVPIPPHGDLIERKAVHDSLLPGMVMTGYQSRALDCINEIYVPTIIEAESGVMQDEIHTETASADR